MYFAAGTFVPAFLIQQIRRCCTIGTTKDVTLINEAIKFAEVRLIDENGAMLGIKSADEAREIANERGYDLVLMPGGATPPVCRIMDYGKYRFDRDKKEKESRKKQQTAEVKQLQITIATDTNDFNTKLRHAERFLKAGDKVRVSVFFKFRRQMQYKDLAYEMLDRFAEGCAEWGVRDKAPADEGRKISVLIVPVKPTPASKKAKKPEKEEVKSEETEE